MASPSQSKKGKSVRIGGDGPRRSKSKRAGLVMPVLQFHRKLKKQKIAKIIRVEASVFMTAVIEYLCAEILEVSGEVAANFNKHRVIPRHICLATRQDEELEKLFRNVVIPDGGVVPNIFEVLLQKNNLTFNHKL